jgi:hypothetical protein
MERKYQRKIKAKPDPSGRLCLARASPNVAAHSFFSRLRDAFSAAGLIICRGYLRCFHMLVAVSSFHQSPMPAMLPYYFIKIKWGLIAHIPNAHLLRSGYIYTISQNNNLF